MDIFDLVLEELDFLDKGKFSFSCKKPAMEENVQVYISQKHVSQVYLIADVQNDKLSEIEKNDIDFFGSMASAFRKQDYHMREMDRNTIVILRCLYDKQEGFDAESRVRIEDTPYFFKRHVFFYTDEEKKSVEKWVSANKNQRSLVECISNYIFDTKSFEKYRSKNGDEIYSYFTGVISKITAFPIHIPKIGHVKTIGEYMSDNITNLSEPIDINRIEALLDMDWTGKVTSEEIIFCWNSSEIEE